VVFTGENMKNTSFFVKKNTQDFQGENNVFYLKIHKNFKENTRSPDLVFSEKNLFFTNDY
jgi:hypothetical protein